MKLCREMLTVHLTEIKRYRKSFRDRILMRFPFGTLSRVNLKWMMNFTTDRKEALLSRRVFLQDYKYKIKFSFLTFFSVYLCYAPMFIHIYIFNKIKQMNIANKVKQLLHNLYRKYRMWKRINIMRNTKTKTED